MKGAIKVFEATLARLDSNLTVSLVASGDPLSFSPDCLYVDAENVMFKRDFSQALVRVGDVAVGVLHVPCERDGATVGERMAALTDSAVVSTNTSLRTIIRALAIPNVRYRLVVGPTGIEGIVTRSDLHKLPVRLLAFSYITHLEALMSELIELLAPGDTWLERLENEPLTALPEAVSTAIKSYVGPGARDRLESFQNKARKRETAPTLIEVTGFPEKWFVTWALLGRPSDFAPEMAEVQMFLRNSVMHSRGYVDDDLELDEFERRLCIIERWTQFLSQMLEAQHGQGKIVGN
jgi:hypothetical protein